MFLFFFLLRFEFSGILLLGCGAINYSWDFALPQLKRLKLRKNNWDSDTYEFDEVLTEFASQKRVYEVVAKPVVEVCYFFGALRGASLL